MSIEPAAPAPPAAPAETRVKTVCPYCGVGCGLYVHVAAGKVVKATGDTKHPANFGKLCTKGLTCAEAVHAPDRLTRAHVRPPHASRAEPPRPVPLDDAIRHVADRLRAIIAQHSPDAVAFYVSGQTSLESQYLVNKLCKGFLRTNNIDSNSRLCMASAASGYRLSLGADGPPGSYQDFERAGCFLVIGANMAECHPILFLRLLAARKPTGAPLIVVDPRRTPTAEKADLHLAIRPGTDLALLNGLLHLLAAAGHIDHAFIAAHTDDWETLRPLLADYPPDRVAALTGLAEADLRLAARWIGEAAEFMSLWTMGLNQSTHGTWQTNALCNLHLATGKICRPGSGPFSLTGQPNAMGGREVGYLSSGLPGQRAVTDPADRAFVEGLWDLPAGAIRAEPGPDAVEMFRRIESGTIKAIWILGTNPVATMPRQAAVARALERAEFVVVQDMYAATETTRHADVLLPAAAWVEAEGTMVNSERMVTLMQKAIEPPGDARADWDLVARVARAMGFDSAFAYDSAAAVFDEIRRSANPRTGYDLRGIDYAGLRAAATQWPCAPGEPTGRPIRYRREHEVEPTSGLRFPTDNGRARFFARPYLPPAEMPDAAFPFILTTGRVSHQWHTRTKTGKVAKLNALNPGPFVELHPEDAATLGVREGQPVEVRSRRGAGVFPARLTARIRPGVCFVPFHWNDLFGAHLTINAATNDAADPISKQPELKFCAVNLTPVAPVAPIAPIAPIAAPIAPIAPDDDSPETLARHYQAGFIAGQVAQASSLPSFLPPQTTLPAP